MGKQYPLLCSSFLFVLVYNYWSGLLCSIFWSVWIGKSHSNLHASDSYSGFGSWSCQFREQSKPNFWQSLQWTHFPTWSSLQPLYSFWANLSHSITMRLTVSFRSRHILHNGGISSPSILFYYTVGSQRLILGSHYGAFCFFLQNAFSWPKPSVCASILFSSSFKLSM